MTEGVFMEEPMRAVGPSSWGRLLRAIPIAVLAALLFGCAGSENEGRAPENMRYLADALVPAHPITERAARSRGAPKKWVGQSARDVCGNSWAIEIKVEGNKVTGDFWLGGINYHIIGFLDSSGRMDGIPARKSRFFRNYIGPREMEFNVTFGAGKAEGEHYFYYGNCLTPMRLVASDK